jgi:Sec7-like guanine-nucleotide exchange factor
VGDASGRRASHAIPRPNVDEETPAGYVERLIEAVSKPEISAVLASSGDEFHTKALKHYIEQFTFENDPLDIAVRRLLMDVALPRETQQIDRVMEAFATRYTQCNPDLFTQPGALQHIPINAD